MAEEAVQNEYSKALQRVIQTSLNHGTLAKGLHEVAKAIERKQAQFCVLAKNCTEANLVLLVKALCKQYDIPLYVIDQAETLGEWIGVAKYDLKGQIR